MSVDLGRFPGLFVCNMPLLEHSPDLIFGSTLSIFQSCEVLVSLRPVLDSAGLSCVSLRRQVPLPLLHFPTTTTHNGTPL